MLVLIVLGTLVESAPVQDVWRRGRHSAENLAALMVVKGCTDLV